MSGQSGHPALNNTIQEIVMLILNNGFVNRIERGYFPSDEESFTYLEEWRDALRSGMFPQGEDFLISPREQYCVLGVDVMIHGFSEYKEDIIIHGFGKPSEITMKMPERIWVNVNGADIHILPENLPFVHTSVYDGSIQECRIVGPITLNDSLGLSFEQIADLL